MASLSRAAKLLRALLAAALLAAAAGRAVQPAGRAAVQGDKCFQKGELCARSFVYTPCCPGLKCDNPSGYDVNAICKAV